MADMNDDRARQVALSMFLEAAYVLGTYNGINCGAQLGPVPAKRMIEPQFVQALALLQTMQDEIDERSNISTFLRYLKSAGVPDVEEELADKIKDEWGVAFEKFQATWVTIPVVDSKRIGGIGRG